MNKFTTEQKIKIVSALLWQIFALVAFLIGLVAVLANWHDTSSVERWLYIMIIALSIQISSKEAKDVTK